MNSTSSLWGASPWQVRPGSEHPFLDVLRKAITRYRLQSLRHHLLFIRVHQVVGKRVLTRQGCVVKLSVGFDNAPNRPIMRECGPQYAGPAQATGRILIMHRNKRILLDDFLSKQFPVNEGPLEFGYQNMLDWWFENGKTFNWTGLPNEIKELILRNCMTEMPYTATDMIRITLEGSFGEARRLVSRFGTLSPRLMKKMFRQPYEITDKFNHSLAFFMTSYQVRCLALRIAFKGSSQFPHHEGLVVNAVGGFEFTERIRNLSRHHQELLEGDAPMNKKTAILAEAYQYYPRIYPTLARYATFAHGIQKLVMSLDYREYYGFFGITVGNFKDYYEYPDSYANYETLEQLPNLRTVVIILPDLWYRKREHPRSRPPLYYERFECPRTLSRYLYERAVHALVLVPNVEIYNLVDRDEEARFRMLRAAATEDAKFTEAELAELYEEDGGGVQLEKAVYRAPSAPVHRRVRPAILNSVSSGNEFWPPKCRCPVQCYDIVHGQAQ